MFTRDKIWNQAMKMMNNTSNSFFLTGKAWTGKSTLIKEFIANTDKKVLVCAPTGIAAINVNGLTIHSLLKIWPKTTRNNVRQIRGWNKELLEECDTIIIDEVSMVRADLMDIVDISLRINTECKDEPFGWKQIILVWDMYQLPPVFEYRDSDLARNFYSYYDTKYFFSALVFQNNLTGQWKFDWPVIQLEKIYRQEDWVFKDLLNKIRDGSITQVDLDTINGNVWKDLWPDAIHLTTLNKMAKAVNATKMEEIRTNSHIYEATFTGAKISNLSLMEDMLIVKPWAQIMMLNNTEFWRNGTVWKYLWEIDWVVTVDIKWTTYPVPVYEQELIVPYIDIWKHSIEYKSVGKMVQYPFKLARAVSIHKAQGSTFDKIYVDLWTWAFDAWQTYVALSRVTKFEWLSLTRPISLRDVILDQDIVEFMNDNQRLS